MSASNFLANGNINPARVVKVDTTSGKNFMVIECSALTDIPIGIAQDGTQDPPGVTGSGAYAATANKGLRVYQDGDECLAEAGGAITHGNVLTVNGSTDARVVSNANGGSTAGYLVGVALEDAAGAGVFIRIKVRILSVKSLT